MGRMGCRAFGYERLLLYLSNRNFHRRPFITYSIEAALYVVCAFDYKADDKLERVRDPRISHLD